MKTTYENCKLLITKGRIENMENSLTLFVLVGFLTNDQFIELSTLYAVKKMELAPPPIEYVPDHLPDLLPDDSQPEGIPETLPQVTPETLPEIENTNPIKKGMKGEAMHE